MKKILLIIHLVLLYSFASYDVKASFYRDKIFLGKNKDEYKYYFTATEYTKETDMMEKINRKVFLLRNELNLLIVAEIPSSLSVSEQESMWDKIKDINSSLKELDYNSNIKFNGYLDKTISTYRIHVYYK